MKTENEIRQDETRKVLNEVIEKLDFNKYVKKYSKDTIEFRSHNQATDEAIKIVQSMLPKEEVKQPIQDEEIKAGEMVMWKDTNGWWEGRLFYIGKNQEGKYVLEAHGKFVVCNEISRNVPTKRPSLVEAERFLKEHYYIPRTSEESDYDFLLRYTEKLILKNKE